MMLSRIRMKNSGMAVFFTRVIKSGKDVGVERNTSG